MIENRCNCVVFNWVVDALFNHLPNSSHWTYCIIYILGKA